MNLFGLWTARHSQRPVSTLLPRSPGRLGAALGLMALAAVAGRAVAAQHARTRAQARPRQPSPQLQTWEGEGGGVPVGGSQTAAQVAPDAGTPGVR